MMNRILPRRLINLKSITGLLHQVKFTAPSSYERSAISSRQSVAFAFIPKLSKASTTTTNISLADSISEAEKHLLSSSRLSLVNKKPTSLATIIPLGLAKMKLVALTSNFRQSLSFRTVIRGYRVGNVSLSQRFKYARRSAFDPSNLIWGIIAINGIVLFAWWYAQGLSQTGDGSRLKFMLENFTLSYDGVVNKGRWWTMITSAFSHTGFLHFGVNMFVLHSFGHIATAMGTGMFVAFYLSSAVTSSLLSLWNQHRKMSSQKPVYDLWGRPHIRQVPGSLGASGCVYGCVSLFALYYPTAPVTLFIFTMPAWVAIGGGFLYDAYRVFSGSEGRIDSAGHVGGALNGLLWWYFRIRPI